MHHPLPRTWKEKARVLAFVVKWCAIPTWQDPNPLVCHSPASAMSGCIASAELVLVSSSQHRLVCHALGMYLEIDDRVGSLHAATQLVNGVGVPAPVPGRI